MLVFAWVKVWSAPGQVRAGKGIRAGTRPRKHDKRHSHLDHARQLRCAGALAQRALQLSLAGGRGAPAVHRLARAGALRGQQVPAGARLLSSALHCDGGEGGPGRAGRRRG